MLSGVGFKPNICLSPDSQVLSYLNQDLNLVRRNLGSHHDDTTNLQNELVQIEFSFANPRHMADDGRSVWMTGQNGILRYDYSSGRIQHYSVLHGLSHNFTFSVCLW